MTFAYAIEVAQYDQNHPLDYRSGSGLLHLFGGSDDAPARIAVDAAGNAYVTGYAIRPTSRPPPAHPDLSGGSRRLRCEAESTGTALVYSTYLGGAAATRLWHRGGRGRQRLCHGLHHPPTSRPPALPANFRRRVDAFVTKLNATGTALVYSTYLGGTGDDPAMASRWTPPATPMSRATPFDRLPDRQPLADHLAAASRRLCDQAERGRPALVYSTYLGGTGDEVGYGIAVDGSGNAYVTGTPVRPTSRPPARCRPTSAAIGVRS